MKKLKNQKGAITILVLVSVLFMVSFLISSYMIIANKVKAQKEMISQMRVIYSNTTTMEETYNSYFVEDIIPIYTKEQLLTIGTEQRVLINGKYYVFSNSPDVMYILMNDLELNTEEDGEWIPINSRGEDFLAAFKGNGHKITVSYKDSVGDEYSIEYNDENSFSELIYDINIKVVDKEGQIVSDAIIYVDDEPQENKGQTIIKLKRVQEVTIYAKVEGYSDTIKIIRKFENPNKIQEDEKNITLTVGKYDFTINPIPVDATVIISANGTIIKNGTGRQTVEVDMGTAITYSVNKTYYYERSGQVTISSDLVIPVILNAKPEQTMVLSPSSVSSSFISSNDANNTEANTDNHAYSSETSELVWNFNASSLNSNAKINSIVIKYRLGTTILGTTAVMTVRVNEAAYFIKTTESLKILLEGVEYEDTLQTLPSAEDIKKSLTLSAKKSSSGLAVLRCYGASITIKYRDP